MKLGLFLKLFLGLGSCALLAFALLPGMELIGLAKMLALACVASIAGAALYPEVRGVKRGDTVSVVSGSTIHGLFGRAGTAMADGKRNGKIRVAFNGGGEITGVVECHGGILTPPKVRTLYEDKMVDADG